MANFNTDMLFFLKKKVVLGVVELFAFGLLETSQIHLHIDSADENNAKCLHYSGFHSQCCW